jgi:mRNA interferase MazF
VAVADFGDLILCQVTSKPYSSSKAIPLVATDFQNGRLPVDSFIRPDKLFTVASSRINKVHGLLSAGKIKLVKQSLRDIFK